jgi:thymidine phosphorylase
VSVSVVSIGGNATGQTVSASTTSAGIRVPANSSVALTYAGGTPTWTWFAD